MNLVTLIVHSPSQARATVNAKVKKRNSRIAENIEVVKVRGERKEKRKAVREGETRSPSSPAAGVEPGKDLFRTTKVRPAAITGGGHHSYSPAKLNFRSAIGNGGV